MIKSISAGENNSAGEKTTEEGIVELVEAGRMVIGSPEYIAAQMQARRNASKEGAARRAELKEAALQVRRATEALGEKYLKLCGVVRQLQATPAEVQDVLSGVGFSPSRISEIKRVSFCSAELFDTFQKKLIGFKPALEKAIEEGGGKETRGRKPQSGWDVIQGVAIKRLRKMAFAANLAVIGALHDVLVIVRGHLCSEPGKAYEFTQGGYRVVVEKLPETKTKKGAPRTPRKKAGRK